ncbi:hypothetical protein [Carbonactinospora thermoautotrophica]|uniref:hypothetical protein n=1 Tax=Carbonactinospora thermoautotrophica TaxID=1469144 RepID=UPI000AAC204E|nr:hypothetical protein [Carbonactinospora thermoautotrophica]
MDGWLGLNADEWSALGSVISAVAATGTLVVAFVAAVAAFKQVREARDLRVEQAQPYVVAYMEPSPTSFMLMDFVVKNIGQTLAKNIQIAFDPPLRSTLDNEDGTGPSKSSILTEGIPSLAPGQEYRMLLEHGPQRYERTDLERSYRVRISFEDRHDRRDAYDYVVDFNTWFGLEQVTVYGVHHIAKALREIEREHKKWRAHTRGLLVYGLDEEDYRERSRQQIEKLRHLREENRSGRAEEDGNSDAPS